MKRPAFQFYPADWRKDPALSACSLAARGLWIELICIAHESERYGHLDINGKPMTPAQLARMVGELPATVAKLLTELEDAGVFSRDEQGCIYSRRMVADERIRNVRSDAGRLGGNPNLVKQKVDGLLKQNEGQNLTPSSSSSSSSSNNTPKAPAAAPDGFAEFWRVYPKKVGKPAAERAFRSAKLNGHLPEVLADVRAKANSPAWTKDGGQFIPNPATYLNQRRWEDLPPAGDDQPDDWTRGAT